MLNICCPFSDFLKKRKESNIALNINKFSTIMVRKVNPVSRTLQRISKQFTVIAKCIAEGALCGENFINNSNNDIK